MLNEFISGFYLAVGFLSWLVGCLMAVLIAALAAALVVAVASWMFDRFTRWLVRRLRKKNRQPRNRLEEIILEHESNAV